MKKTKIILALLTLMNCLSAIAQKFPEQYLFYHKGMKGDYGILPSSMIDSLVFESEDVELYSLTLDLPVVDTSGNIEITAHASTGFSIDKVLCKLLPSSENLSVSEEAYLMLDMRQQYISGTLAGLQEMQDNRCTFSIEPGTYRVFALALDKEGTLRNMRLSECQTFPGALKDKLLKFQTCKDITDGVSNDSHSWGYGAVMHMRDLMGEDMTRSTQSGNDHFGAYQQGNYLGAAYANTYSAYLYYHRSIVEINDVIQTCERRRLKNDDLNATLSQAYAMRAFNYLDLARMYEFLPTDAVSNINIEGNDVTGLTVPIITEPMSSWNNPISIPRATHDEMVAFILSDLDKAEQLASSENASDKTLPSLAAIYGLKARTYLWNNDYANALEYALKVLQECGYHYNSIDGLKLNKGYNDSSAPNWIFSMNYNENSEGASVRYNNWVSWCTNETSYGYCSSATGMYTCINRALYDKIASTDIRKHMFKGTTENGEDLYYNPFSYIALPHYASLKFHPKDADNFEVATLVDIPLMRTEEMFFIVMECDLHLGNFGSSLNNINNFTRNLRDPEYEFDTDNKEELLKEILLQKRIEFWGEGINFFDYKRLNLPVTRGYDGTNFYKAAQFNTTTRPAWMNFVIPKTFEEQYNTAIQGYNNPDPSGCYSSMNY